MLHALRKSAASPAGKLILGVLVVAFSAWGVNDMLKAQSRSVAAKVGETDIQTDALAREFSRMARRAGMGLDDARKAGLDQVALNVLTSQAALDAEAKKFGLAADDALIAKTLQQNQNFQDSFKNFDRALYRQVLARNGFTESEYESQMRLDLSRAMLTSAAVAGAEAPRAVIESIEKRRNEKRAVSWLKFRSSEQPAPAAPTDEQLKAHHEAQAIKFTTPELRGADWVALTPGALAKPADVSEDEIKKRYEAHPEKYNFPERRRLEQLVFADEAAATAAADKFKAGTPFAKLVEEAGKKPDEVQLGAVTREEAPSELAEAAFGLKEPGATPPFKSAFGWTIGHVSAIQPAKTITLDEARKNLADEIARDRARAKITDMLLEVEDLIAGGRSLKEVGEKYGAPSGVVEASDKDGFDAGGLTAPNLPSGLPNFLQALFAQDEKALPRAVQSTADDGAVFFLKVNKITPAALKPLESVKAQVTASWSQAEQARAAEAAAQKAAERVKAGEKLEAVAADLKLTINELPAFGRQETPEDLGADVVKALFAAEKGAPVSGAARLGDGFVMAVPTSIVEPEETVLAEAIEGTRQQFNLALRADLSEALAAAAVKAQGLEVFPAGVQTALDAAR